MTNENVTTVVVASNAVQRALLFACRELTLAKSFHANAKGKTQRFWNRKLLPLERILKVPEGIDLYEASKRIMPPGKRFDDEMYISQMEVTRQSICFMINSRRYTQRETWKSCTQWNMCFTSTNQSEIKQSTSLDRKKFDPSSSIDNERLISCTVGDVSLLIDFDNGEKSFITVCGDEAYLYRYFSRQGEPYVWMIYRIDEVKLEQNTYENANDDSCEINVKMKFLLLAENGIVHASDEKRITRFANSDDGYEAEAFRGLRKHIDACKALDRDRLSDNPQDMLEADFNSALEYILEHRCDSKYAADCLLAVLCQGKGYQFKITSWQYMLYGIIFTAEERKWASYDVAPRAVLIRWEVGKKMELYERSRHLKAIETNYIVQPVANIATAFDL